MAVTDNLTLIEDMEGGGPTTTNWPTGGQGASNDTDLFFEGLAATSMKVDNTTKGYWMNPGSTFDLSGSGEHLKIYAAITTPALLTGYRIGIGHVANSDFEEHEIDLSFYPATAGWVPVWVAVGEGVDTNSPDFTIADEFGAQGDMGNVGGNLKNFLADIIHHGTRPALIWDGTGGDLDDFIAAEVTDSFGVLALINGIYTCYASLEIGSASETSFDAAGKVLSFPDAVWLPAASTWMGLDFDLSHASTILDWTGGSVLSGNATSATARKPDIIVVGTSGALDFSNRVFDGMRIITFTAGVTMVGGAISNSGQIIAAASTVSGVSIIDPTDDGAVLVTDVDDLDDWSNITFDGAGVGGAADDAAIEIDISGAGPHTIDLDKFLFQNRVGSSVDLHFLDQGSDRDYTVNILNNGTSATFTKDRAGDTVDIVSSKQATFTPVEDGSAFTITRNSDNLLLLDVPSTTGGEVDYSYDGALDGTAATVHLIIIGKEPIDFPWTVAEGTVPIAQITDRVYSNQ
jgi:hypothetical protein